MRSTVMLSIVSGSLIDVIVPSFVPSSGAERGVSALAVQLRFGSDCAFTSSFGNLHPVWQNSEILVRTTVRTDGGEWDSAPNASEDIATHRSCLL